MNSSDENVLSAKHPEKRTGSPRVSVLILACNHEPYIRQALDGVVNQETNFEYEVYVHDDASKDGTVEIIKSYQGEYPNLIKTIFQTENQYSKGVNPLIHHLYPRLESDYVAFCEGDDYWVDPFKLQKQVAFMDAHPEYVVCSHDVHVKFEEGMAVKEVYYKKPSEGSFSFTFLDEFLNHFIATASVLTRREIALQIPSTRNIVSVDIYSILYLLSKGKGYYMAEKMVVKRRNLGGITMNPAYRKTLANGICRMWQEVLAFAPAPYKVLIRLKLAEFQRQLVKNYRVHSPDISFVELLFGAVFNDPFWLFGLTETYRRRLLKRLSV